MVEKKYNLLDEPWIIVLDDNNLSQKISVLDLFRNAHRLKRLAGELPTQDIAILRILLAVLYAVFTRVDIQGNALQSAGDKSFRNTKEALAQWETLWRNGQFPLEVIEQYLKYYADRFYLFHSETPFFQVAGLTASDGQIKETVQMIADVPSRQVRRFFSNRLGNQIGRLEYDEAARWLVDLQAWDYAGKKNSVRGGTENGGGTGWLGKLGVVYLTGRNLFETLMLNFVLVNDGALIEFGEPVWEQEPRTAAKRECVPKGYVDLLTWQSRRTLLFEREGKVTGMLESYGDVFEKEGVFIEQMTGFHLSSEKSDGNKYIPNTLNKERNIWRDLNALLPMQITSDNTIRIPGVVTWRGVLEEENAIDTDIVNIATVGAEYGAMMGVVNEIITDQISFSANLLTEMGKAWIPYILNILGDTEKCVNALAMFARDLMKAAGADEKDKKATDTAASSARGIAYDFFDNPFRGWLAGIDPNRDDKDSVCIKWKTYMREEILRMGRELVSEAGERVYVGRDAKNNAASASLRFKGSIYKIVPIAQKGGPNG